VKSALTSGAHTLAALQDLVTAAETRQTVSPGYRQSNSCRRFRIRQNSSASAKNNKKHREELAANKMLTEVPNEPTGFIKLISTMSGDGDEVTKT